MPAKSPSPTDPLLGATAKLNRAIAHLKVLEQAVKPFTTPGDCYSIISEPNREAGVYVFRLKVLKAPDFVAWSLMIGDCIHNARSALDHIYWALALLEHGSADKIPRPTFATFRIADNPDRFTKSEPLITRQIGAKATAVLKGVQPSSTKSPLWLLHDYDITDKHKLLLPVISIVQRGSFAFNHTPGATESDSKTVYGPDALVDGGEIVRVIVTPPESVLGVNFNAPRLGMRFENTPGRLSAIEALWALMQHVADVGAEFLPFFPASHYSASLAK